MNDPSFLLTLLPTLGEQHTVHAGRTLFRRGDRPGKLFWVLEGELRLLRTTAGGDDLVLQRCRQGPLAEASLFSERYHCDGIAAVDTALIAIPRSRFLAAFEDPPFARAYAQWLSGSVRELRSSCERLTLRRAPSRIEHYLEEYGRFECGPGRGNLKDWAAQLGLTHESLYRTLAAMEADDRIVRESGCIRLAD
jgi:CRP-like cAMP-binding protein